MTDPNQYAFPIDLSRVVNDKMSLGLTKREYFAAMAMQGILSNASGLGEPEHWVRFAVKYADALIKELSKGEK